MTAIWKQPASVELLTKISVNTASEHVGIEFTEGVVEALARMRFHPATIAEKAVSQVVEQDFGFRIEPAVADSAAQPRRDTTESRAHRS